MCFRRKKKVAETPVTVDTPQEEVAEKVIKPMEVFLDISMVPVAPPKTSGVFRPEVLPEEFVLYKQNKD